MRKTRKRRSTKRRTKRIMLFKKIKNLCLATVGSILLGVTLSLIYAILLGIDETIFNDITFSKSIVFFALLGFKSVLKFVSEDEMFMLLL